MIELSLGEKDIKEEQPLLLLNLISCVLVRKIIYYINKHIRI